MKITLDTKKTKRTKKKTKKKTSNIMLVIVCIMIFGYTAASFVLQYFTQVEISPTLTTAWFTFWSVEILALMGIRVSKVIKGNAEDESCG
jgi:uncharacterized membrane protein YwzB